MSNDRLRYDGANYFDLPDGPQCLSCNVDMGLEKRDGNRCDYLCTACCQCERCEERREEAKGMMWRLHTCGDTPSRRCAACWAEAYDEDPAKLEANLESLGYPPPPWKEKN